MQCDSYFITFSKRENYRNVNKSVAVKESEGVERKVAGGTIKHTQWYHITGMSMEVYACDTQHRITHLYSTNASFLI